MSFGLLGSLEAQVNRNQIFYSAESPNLTIGKVSISSRNYNPVKVRLGITVDGLNIDYLIYNKYINYGETFETDTIHLGGGQNLVARSSDPDVNFLFYGETINESANPVKSGLLSSVQSTDRQKKTLYTAPEFSNAIVTLSVCNLDSQPGRARIGISSDGIDTFNTSEYLEYDVEIGPNQTYTRTEIKLFGGQTLICSSSDDSNINFVCHGRLIYDIQSGDDLYIAGRIGVGTLAAREKLDVIGNVLISDSIFVSKNATIGAGLSVSGPITGIITSSSLNKSLENLQILPAIDGSRLTGIVATGSGVILSQNNVAKGPASTINFGDNISVDVISGIGTVAFTDDVNIRQNLTVATNKFVVNGSSGNTQITGTLSVSNNINALNNKVINVGSATSLTDATNKNYVDTRSIAMSIALS